MAFDLVCFSHLRWNFVYQRPNHLMARAARDRRVFFVQEPADGPRPGLEKEQLDGVTVVTPIVRFDQPGEMQVADLRAVMASFYGSERLDSPVHWYYTPMALRWTAHLPASTTVYDVMDELSSFRFAPAELVELERELLRRADVVFTGGRQLYEAKRNRHANVHLFPSSVDAAHFAAARNPQPDPDDQAGIPRPRVGYYGVIDERMDLELLHEMADRRPDWQLVLVGPIAKIEAADLPVAPNVHHLGPKTYEELPRYLAGWDVAMMPFALNEATRHISPTKTPEYLAGGRPVASTPIRDVVDPYGTLGLVSIGDGPTEFIAAVERALAADPNELRRRADALLGRSSWDRTWQDMERLVLAALQRRATARRPAAALTGAIAAPARPEPTSPRVSSASAAPTGARAGAGE